MPVQAMRVPLPKLEPEAVEQCCFSMEKRGQIGGNAQIPNAALQPLSFLVGRWRTAGRHPLVPGQDLSGVTSFAWTEGGAFLMMRSEVHAAEFPDGVALIGSDIGAGKMTMMYFDERGVSRIMDVTPGDGTVTWRHDNPEFAQCLTIAADGDRLVSTGRMSEKGGPWKEDLPQVFEKMD